MKGDVVQFASALRSRLLLKTQRFPGNIQKHDLFLGKKRIGNLDVEKNKVIESYIFDEYRNLGLGKKLYGEAMKRTPGKWLRSDDFPSPQAERVWRSMAKKPKSYAVKRSVAGGQPIYRAKLTAMDRLMSRVVEFRVRQPQEEEKPHALKRIARVVAPLAVGALAYKYFYRRPNKDPMPNVVTPAMARLQAQKAADQAVSAQRRSDKAILRAAVDARRSERVAKLTAPAAAPAAPAPVAATPSTTPTLKLVRRQKPAPPAQPSGPAPGSVAATAPKGDELKLKAAPNKPFVSVRNDDLQQTYEDVTKPAIKEQVAKIRAAQTARSNASFADRGNSKMEGTAKTPEFVTPSKKAGKAPIRVSTDDPDAIERAIDAGFGKMPKKTAAKSAPAPAPKPAKPAPVAKAAKPASVAKAAKSVPAPKPSKPAPAAKPAKKGTKTMSKSQAAQAARADALISQWKAEQKRAGRNYMSALVKRAILFNTQDPFYGNQMATPAGFMSAYRKGRRLVPWIRRGTQVAEDAADIAVGKKPKDPFYKKTWFKSAAAGAAIGSALYANRQLRRIKRTVEEGGGRMLPNYERKAYQGVKKYAPWFINNLSAKTRKIVELAFDAEMRGWDIRDARGRSARVYAPGSQRRQRREKEWGERTENIRLVRNAALAAAAAGAAGLGYSVYRGKDAVRVLKRQYRDRIKAKMGASNNPGVIPMPGVQRKLVSFARKSTPALHNVTDAVRDNLPERPDLPGERAVRVVVENKKARASLLRILGAGTLAGSGSLAGMALKRPKSGALIGGLGAGLVLRG